MMQTEHDELTHSLAPGVFPVFGSPPMSTPTPSNAHAVECGALSPWHKHRCRDADIAFAEAATKASQLFIGLDFESASGRRLDGTFDVFENPSSADAKVGWCH